MYDAVVGSFGPELEETFLENQWGFEPGQLWEQGLVSIVYIGGFTLFAMMAASLIRFVK